MSDGKLRVIKKRGLVLLPVLTAFLVFVLTSAAFAADTPGTPVLSAIGSASKVTLSWQCTPLPYIYKLFKGESIEELLNNISNGNDFNTFVDTQTSYEDWWVETGKTYYYKIVAYDNAGYAAESNLVSVTTSSDTEPPNIQSIKGSPYTDSPDRVGPKPVFTATISENNGIQKVCWQYRSNSGEQWIDLGESGAMRGSSGEFISSFCWNNRGNLPSGIYYIRAVAFDTAGNLHSLDRAFEIVDLPATVIRKLQPRSEGYGFWVDYDELWNPGFEPVYQGYRSTNGGPFEKINLPGEYDWTADWQNNSYAYYVVVTRPEYNQYSQRSNIVSWESDLTGPVISNCQPAETNQRVVDFSGTVTDNKSGVATVFVRLQTDTHWQECSLSGNTFSAQLEMPEIEGYVTLEIEAADRKGNVTVTSHTVRVDRIPPRISIQAPAENETVPPLSRISFTIIDAQPVDPDHVWVSLDGEAVPVAANLQVSPPLYWAVPGSPLDDGRHRLVVAAEDALGNRTTADRSIFTEYREIEFLQFYPEPYHEGSANERQALPTSELRVQFREYSGSGATVTGVKIDGEEVPASNASVFTMGDESWVRVRPAAPMNAGQHCLELILEDGLKNSQTYSVAFEVFGYPPAIEIVSPREGEKQFLKLRITARITDQAFYGAETVNTSVYLDGADITSEVEDAITVDSANPFVLNINFEKYVSGADPWGNAFSHRLTVIARDKNGKEARKDVGFTVYDRIYPLPPPTGWKSITLKSGAVYQGHFKLTPKELAEFGDRIPLVFIPRTYYGPGSIVGPGHEPRVRLKAINPETRDEYVVDDLRLQFFGVWEPFTVPKWNWPWSAFHSFVWVPRQFVSSTGEFSVDLTLLPDSQWVSFEECFHIYVGYPYPNITGGGLVSYAPPAEFKPVSGSEIASESANIRAYIVNDAGSLTDIKVLVDGNELQFSYDAGSGLLTANTGRLEPDRWYTLTVKATNEYGRTTLARSTIRRGKGLLWKRISDSGTEYRVYILTEKPLTEQDEARLRNDYFIPRLFGLSYSGNRIKRIMIYRCSPEGEEPIADPEQCDKILLAGMRQAFYTKYGLWDTPIAQGLIDWVNEWKDKWGPEGLYVGGQLIGADPEEPASRLDVYKAAISRALALSGLPGLPEAANDALEVFSTVTEGASQASDFLEACKNAKALKKLTSTQIKAFAKFTEGLELVEEGISLNKKAMETIYMAYWQAALMEEYRETVRKMRPCVADLTHWQALGDLMNFNPEEVNDAIKNVLVDYVLGKIGDELRDKLKDAVTKVNPVAGAVFIGLDIGYFVADFTGWDKMHACDHRASDEAAFEASSRATFSALTENIKRVPGRAVDLEETNALALCARMVYAGRAAFYSTVAEITDELDALPDFSDKWSERGDSYRAAAESAMERAKSIIPGNDVALQDFLDYRSCVYLPGRDIKTMRVSAYSPVNIMVVDPLGQRTGADDAGNIYLEIPGSSYTGPGTEPQTIILDNPLTGGYRIKVFGTGAGTYTIKVATSSESPETISQKEYTGIAAAGQNLEYSVVADTWGTLADEAEVPVAIAVHNLAVNPDFLTNSGGNTTISFAVNKKARIDVLVFDSDITLIKKLMKDEEKNAGTVSLIWDCKDDAGKPIPGGRYFVRVVARELTQVTNSDLIGMTLGNTTQAEVWLQAATATDSPDNGATDSDAKQQLNGKGEVAAAEKEYRDLKGHWAYNCIEVMTKQSVVVGYPGDEFRPEQSITRTEFAVILARFMKLCGKLEKAEASSALNKMFVDQLSIPEWARESIALLVKQGVVIGYPDGTFRPSEKITRAEAFQMLTKALNFEFEPVAESGELYFDDVYELDQSTKKAIQCLVDKRLITGYPDNTFRPRKSLTRAETCAVLYRIYVA